LNEIKILKVKTIVLGDITLMNTSILEVAIPGFLNIDFINQIRKEEKIGGGGFATIYKGVILDSKLSEVGFYYYYFFER